MMAAATRVFMESRFGHNFSRVRVHTDGRAAESAAAVNAKAYTVGTHIVFGKGQYEDTASGTSLVAHELAHVVQQESTSDALSSGVLRMGACHDGAEREADAAAAQVSAGASAAVRSVTGISLRGAWLGAGLGALTGGGLGAAIGAFFGPIGALVGAGIGLVAGGLIGGIPGAAAAIWDEVKAVGRAIGKAAEAVWEAVVAAGRAIGAAAEGVWGAIKEAAAAVGRTIWDFLRCLYEGGRGLARRALGGPYQFCSFPSKEQKWLIPLGAVLGLLWPGGLAGMAVGAVTGFLIPLLYHCFREAPGLKPRIGWARIPTKARRASGRQCMTGRLVKDPCIAADDGDINLHVAPCEGDQDLVEPGNCTGEAAEGGPGGVFVECELPYMLFEERFRARPRGGDFVRVCGEWVYDLGHGKKSELHPFDELEPASRCRLATTIPACASAAAGGTAESAAGRREGGK